MSDRNHDEFYVGYMPEAPSGLGVWLKKRILLLLVVTSLIGLLLVVAQGPFAPAFFEFGNERTLEGVIIEKPYPSLRVDRPGVHSGETGSSRYYLVAPGKFGASSAVAGLDGKRVTLDGTLVYRGDQTMLEIKPESITVLGESAGGPDQKSLGTVTLVGEIVDSKCFLGVMNPGNLKPHKACAIRCISGGIPPILLVRGQEGDARHFLLVSETGETVNQDVLEMVAEPIEITGRLVTSDNLMVLYADPANYRRLNSK